MPATADFYSVHELKRPFADRVYNDNYACPLGSEIPQTRNTAGQ
jgi:hypothetical protein